MAAATAVQSASYIPAILREQARLDGIPLQELQAQVDWFEDIPEPPLPRPEPRPVEQEEQTLPLHDRNGIFVRHISQSEAQKLVNSGQAVGQMAAGWDSTMRQDLPWLSVKLVLARDVIAWDPSGITCEEMKMIAGEHGDCAAARLARIKLRLWKETK